MLALLSDLPTVLAVLAKLIAERANRYPQDDRRVSAIAAAMLHGVDDQVAFNLRDRLSDKGGNPESSACLTARGVSSRRLTKVTCWLPHPNCSKAIVLALAHCRRSTWSKLDRFRSEFVTLSRNLVTRVNDRRHSAEMPRVRVRRAKAMPMMSDPVQLCQRDRDRCLTSHNRRAGRTSPCRPSWPC